MNKPRSFATACFVAALAGAIWPAMVRYGLCGGSSLAVALALACAALGGILSRLPPTQSTALWLPVFLLVAAATSFLISAAVSRQPSPEAVFREHLHINMPAGITDARACARWVFTDPAYAMRFRVEHARTLLNLAATLNLTPDESPARFDDTLGLGGAPAWWDPRELIACPTTQPSPTNGTTDPSTTYRTWRNHGDPFIILYACPQSGVAYLLIAYP